MLFFSSNPHIWKVPGKIKFFVADYLHDDDWHTNKNYYRFTFSFIVVCFIKPEMNLRFEREINMVDLKLTAIRRKTLGVHSPLKYNLMMSKKIFIDSKNPVGFL